MPGRDGLEVLRTSRQPARFPRGHHDLRPRDDRDGRRGDQAGRLRFPGETPPPRAGPPDASATPLEPDDPAQARKRRPAERKAEKRYELVGSIALDEEALQETIQRVAPTNATVLISGESGTGKELIARADPRPSLRAARPLRPGQLRRHPRGAHRERAVRPREGLVHRGHREEDRASSSRPTAARIFLDEIGDMSLKTQAKVLRVLEEGEVQPVGVAARSARSTSGSSPPPTRT